MVWGKTISKGVNTMALTWLSDKADTNNMSLIFKERGKRNNDEKSYSVTFSKSLKEYIKEEKFNAVRFGFERTGDDVSLALSLNKDDVGISVIGMGGEPRKWFDVTYYITQYLENDIDIKFATEYKAELKKNGLITLTLDEDEDEE